MTKNIISLQFEQYLQEKTIAGEATNLNEIVFANIPNLDPDAITDRNITLPPAAQIVHRQAIDQIGKINQNSVAYSVVLPADGSTFTFNTMFLIDNTNPLGIGVAVYKGAEIKDATTTLIKTIVMEFSGAAEAGNITVDAETWQLDYSERVNGIDEDHRNSLNSIFSNRILSGLQITKAAGANDFTVSAGQAIIGGLLVTSATNQTITVGAKPTSIFLDVHRQGTSLGKHENILVIRAATTLDNYEQDGLSHYVFKIASVNADDSINDQASINKVPTNQSILSQIEDKAISKMFKGLLTSSGFGDFSAVPLDRGDGIYSIAALGAGSSYIFMFPNINTPGLSIQQAALEFLFDGRIWYHVIVDGRAWRTFQITTTPVILDSTEQ